MTNTIVPITGFLLELDALKHVNRRSYITGGQRIENSAEHSWHLAMACWSISRSFKLNIDEGKLLKLALVHDLGEIDAGDTFLYASNRSDANIKERECVSRLSKHCGNGIDDLAELWEIQESGDCLETRLLKAVDRLLPFLLGVATEGKTWKELGVDQHKVRRAHEFIARDFPELHAWMKQQIDLAVENGWLMEN